MYYGSWRPIKNFTAKKNARSFNIRACYLITDSFPARGTYGPLSALFAAVLESTSGAVNNHMQESLGIEVKTVTVDHNNQRISFQHQLWRIRDESVCVDKRDRMAEFSKCTLAAKEFFSDACRYLRESRGSGLKYDKTENMYCAASSSFKPTIAFVASARQDSPLELAKRECNRLILQQSVSVEARNQACARYEALKRQEL